MVYRVYSEKKREHAVEAQSVAADLRENLGLTALREVRLLNRYDVENIPQDIFERAKKTVFSEPQVDEVYDTLPAFGADAHLLAVEYLPGQYDQRADSCAQCIQIMTQQERPLVSTAKVYVLVGELTEQEVQAAADYLINPVESRRADMAERASLQTDYEVPQHVATLDGFLELDQAGLADFVRRYGLAMDEDDIAFCQEYFRTEQRDPTMTEIRMIDTYWSDHCRHTTFLTRIDKVTVADGEIQEAFEQYLADRRQVYGERLERKPVCLMDIATLGAKKLKADGLLEDLDASDEINACSIHIKADVDGKPEDWLLMFKNETHNHPTEIEPFGGAATCLGGAIRDPLSGRTYVYQAMRVTGAADPRRPVSETIPGKLSQKKLVCGAANGYSSYGNQIGLCTGFVNEIYHEGYAAKRLEIGAVLGAAPKENVRRCQPQPGDAVILLGGRTGRDGCGGATGSSKSHTADSLTTCGAEVQKGNPPEERKLQRLFRNPAVTKMIKRCNDFGAGGVSVAIGELADGLDIDLDAVPKKYEGLDGTELAISESQERMAVVIAAEDTQRFIEAAARENLLAVRVATVTDKNRLCMTWNGHTVVDVSRDFLNSNGAEKHTEATVLPVADDDIYQVYGALNGQAPAEGLKTLVSDLNVCSQKGLVERFDSSIGACAVTNPYGGAYQQTPVQFMASKIPMLKGKTDTASVMAYGFSPAVSEKSPYHGAMTAVVESAARVVASGAPADRIRLTLQEYFPRTQNDPLRWGLPMAALLGAYRAQIALGMPAIGGKDSMSGTFEKMDVPPTLVSFAVSVTKASKVITPEFKRARSKVYAILPRYNGLTPDFESVKKCFAQVHGLCEQGKVLSAWAIGVGGIAEALFKMAIGNMVGFCGQVPEDLLYRACFGGFVLEGTEVPEGAVLLGETVFDRVLEINGSKADLDELVALWHKPLEKVFPTRSGRDGGEVGTHTCRVRPANIHAKLGSIAKPRVLIPVFPGTNCEYDSARRFEMAGAEAVTPVLRNLTAEALDESLAEMASLIDNSQIIMIPGGFSGGDEPEGSAKFIAAVFRNPRVKEAVLRLMERRDGLMLGICNGFQALVKLGLLPYGTILDEMPADAPTLTFNHIGRHQAMMVRTRISSVKSPWLSKVEAGDLHTIPVSHGEGRFFADEAHLKMLIENGRIATQYVDVDGKPTMLEPFNPNGSVEAIEGILSADGRILGKMGHSERIGDDLAKNMGGARDQFLFESGVEYFK